MDLLNLDQAVEFLRGAYTRRTLKNLAWKGRLRHIGRGERMLFRPQWLVDDLQRRQAGGGLQGRQP